MVEKKENNSYAMIAIVAIVAIVGIVMMFVSNKNTVKTAETSEMVTVYDDNGNAVGQLMYAGGCSSGMSAFEYAYNSCGSNGGSGYDGWGGGGGGGTEYCSAANTCYCAGMEAPGGRECYHKNVGDYCGNSEDHGTCAK